jgi:MoaA/NifB/PqqE/SkfB family radical SAM enzyme
MFHIREERKDMRNSKYWDSFLERADETEQCLISGNSIPVRRVAIFITNKCQMKCRYCNHVVSPVEMSKECFESILDKHGKEAIYHITGGEPSTVKWLYPFIRENGSNYRFHLNTNALVLPPAQQLQRVKVSLDSYDKNYWNGLVGLNAFDIVVGNIKKCIPLSTVSITYTMTKENYKDIPKFIEFYNREFSSAYAVFFSVYKGCDTNFAFDQDDVNCFFDNIKPIMDKTLDDESRSLLNETIEEKFRIMQGVRFPENENNPCYLSMSERVYSPSGTMSGCSHLFRDGIIIEPGLKHEKCKYGCNRRLVAFNKEIEERAKAHRLTNAWRAV